MTLASGWAAISCPSGARTAVQSGSGASYTLNPDTDFAAGEVCSVTVTAAKVADIDGTVTPMAARERVRVTRVQAGKAETLIVNFKAIAEGSQSFYLQPGDTVSVDERLF